MKFIDIKKGKIPDAIQKFPLISKLLQCMINEDANSRPSVKEILQIIKEYVSTKDKPKKVKDDLEKFTETKEKRKRFYSEDIQKFHSYSLLMKIGTEGEIKSWKNM